MKRGKTSVAAARMEPPRREFQGVPKFGLGIDETTVGRARGQEEKLGVNRVRLKVSLKTGGLFPGLPIQHRGPQVALGKLRRSWDLKSESAVTGQGQQRHVCEHARLEGPIGKGG